MVKKTKKEIVKPEIIESKLESKRYYTCSCGVMVVLEGEIHKRKVKDGFELCSSCSK